MNNLLLEINGKDRFIDVWRNQLPRIRFSLLISLCVALITILGTYAFSLFKDVPVSSLTRDPAQVTGVGPYIGMLSTLGIMGWTATTAICFWAALLLRRDRHFYQSSLFLLISGLFTLILTIDDAFMFHEIILPKLHIPQKVVFLGYLLMFAGYGGYFLRRFLKTDYLLLIAALFFLGLSAGIDQFFSFSNFESFLEDCLKFTGILVWLAYFSRTTFSILNDYCRVGFKPDEQTSTSESLQSNVVQLQ